MSFLTYLIIFLILIINTIYTISYGVWTWKEKNKFGAVVIFLLATSVVVLPVFMLFYTD